jgi:hypothetical protein
LKSSRVGKGLKGVKDFEVIEGKHSDERPYEDELSEEGILGSIHRKNQGRYGRSEFSEENSRIPVSRHISGRSREVTVQVWKGSKLRRGRTIDPSHKGHLIYS